MFDDCIYSQVTFRAILYISSYFIINIYIADAWNLDLVHQYLNQLKAGRKKQCEGTFLSLAFRYPKQSCCI